MRSPHIPSVCREILSGLPGNHPYEILDAQAGCCAIADSFNRRFMYKSTSVSKSYVNDDLRKHAYEIQVVQKKASQAKTDTAQ